MSNYTPISITDYYETTEDGIFAISSQGSQKVTNNLNTYSELYSNLYCSELNNKFCMDSCWESGNIYYANYSNGLVKKINYTSRSVIASLQLINPISVSVVQNEGKMAFAIESPPQEDRGCWITDKGLKQIIRTDKNLNILAEVNCVDEPICAVSKSDGGCYGADNFTRTIFRVSSNGNILAVKSYDDFNPTLSNVVEMRVNYQDELWIASSEYVYKLSEGFSQLAYLSPFDESLLITGEIKDIDVDRQNDDIYVVGSSDEDAWIIKYDTDGVPLVMRTNINMAYVILLRVVQNPEGTCLYILQEESPYSSSSSSESTSSVSSHSSSTSSSSSSSSKSSSSSTSRSSASTSSSTSTSSISVTSTSSTSSTSVTSTSSTSVTSTSSTSTSSTSTSTSSVSDLSSTSTSSVSDLSSTSTSSVSDLSSTSTSSVSDLSSTSISSPSSESSSSSTSISSSSSSSMGITSTSSCGEECVARIEYAYDCGTSRWALFAQYPTSCVPIGSYVEGWQNFMQGEDGCLCEYYALLGPCCEDGDCSQTPIPPPVSECPFVCECP